MNTIVLPRTAGRLRAVTALIRRRIGAFVRVAVHDRVVQVFALGLLALGALDTAQLPASAGFVAGALIGIAPFLVLAVAIAAYAGASGADPRPALRAGRGRTRSTCTHAGRNSSASSAQ